MISYPGPFVSNNILNLGVVLGVLVSWRFRLLLLLPPQSKFGVSHAKYFSPNLVLGAFKVGLRSAIL